jgi:hypothetical protein
MGIRRAFFIVALLLVPVAAYADRHRADMFVGPFKATGSNYTGWQASGSWPMFPCKSWSVVGTFGRYKGTEDDDPLDHTLVTYIIGGRKTWHNLFGKEVLPFIQVLGGGVDNIRELDVNLREVHSHAVAIAGIGIQPAITKKSLNKKTGKRVLEPRWRLRLQLDLFHRWDEDFTGGFKAGGFGAAGSVGLVFQFGPDFPCGEQSDRDCPTAPPNTHKHAARLVPAERRGPPAPGERVDAKM